MGVGKGETEAKGRESGRKEGCAGASFALFPFQLAKAANTSLSCTRTAARSGVKTSPRP